MSLQITVHCADVLVVKVWDLSLIVANGCFCVYQGNRPDGSYSVTLPCDALLHWSHWHKQLLKATLQVHKAYQMVSSDTIIGSIQNLPPVRYHIVSALG